MGSFIYIEFFCFNMKIKKGDFIEIEFVGRLDDGKIFDLNSKDTAKKEGLKQSLDKVIICVGEEDVVKGLDDSFLDKEVNAKFNVDVPSDKAFGKRDPKLFQLISLNKFKDNEMRPYPGLQINVDGRIGIIKTVSGGRIMVDFNHPLAGRNLKYEVTIKKIIEDTNEKIEFSLKNLIGKAKHEFKEGKLTIYMDLPSEVKKILEERLKTRIKEIKEIEFKK